MVYVSQDLICLQSRSGWGITGSPGQIIYFNPVRYKFQVLLHLFFNYYNVEMKYIIYSMQYAPILF